MQVKKLALALAIAITTPSAFAINLETAPDSPVTVPAANIINIIGATAQTKGIAISLDDICASASVPAASRVFYSLTDGTAAPVGKAWKCQVPAGTTFSKLSGVTGPWIVRKNEGGSLNAITPMRNGSTQTQLNTNNCTVTVVGSVGTGTCSGLTARDGHIGFSDVSEKIFKAKGQLVTQTAGNTYVPDIAVGQTQGFGIAVSPALYERLQIDQGVTGIPNISKNQMATLMSTQFDPWGVLLPNGTAHPLSNTVTLARRSTTSGTQAAAEIYFLNNPCNAGTAPIGGSANAQAAGTYGNLVVTQASSSDAVLTAASGAGYALGIVSLENAQPASSWKFVAVDGVHPGTPGAPEWQRKNIINGTYDFTFETFMFRNTKAALDTTTPGILNNISDFTTGLLNDLGVGANLNDTNGIAGDPFAPLADLGPETSAYTRGGNECAVQTRQF
jgi:hypothetical protein